MLDRYGLIGKKVESGSDVILAYRFVNLKTNEIIEVDSSDLLSFVSSHQVTNVRLNPYLKELEMVYQHLNYIPVYRSDGTVSSYYYKVILDNPSLNNYVVANITGGFVNCQLPKFFFKFYDLLNDKGFIVSTKDKSSKFTIKVDGSFKCEEIDSSIICDIEPIKMYDSKRSTFSTKECNYLGSSYYYFDLNDLDTRKGLFLTSSKLNGQFTGIYAKRGSLGYTLKSTSVRSSNMNNLDNDINNFNLDSFNVYKTIVNYSWSYYMVGLDGLTCVGKPFVDLHNDYLDEYYNRLVTVSPDDAELLKKNLKVGSCGDLVYCNIALLNIPDGITSIGNHSLCFDLDASDDKLYQKYVYGDKQLDDIVIPSCVEKCSNVAFSNSFNQNIADIIARKTNLYVSNPLIANNVLNSVIYANIKFKSVVINGDLNLSYSLLKRLYEYEKYSSIDSSNFKLFLCRVNTMNNGLVFKPAKKLKNIHLETCSILPYMYTAMDLKEFKVLFFKTYSDFESVFSLKLEEAWREYEELKIDYKKLNNKKDFLEYENKVRNFFSNYSLLRNMILGSCIIDGDLDSYLTLCRKVESRYNNVLSLLNEKLRLIRIDKSLSWGL